jgi:hypothetical protein
VITKVPEAEVDPQVTVAVAVPLLVLLPVIQFHRTWPDASAVAGPRPDDWLSLPLGNVTDRLQVAFGEFRATKLA